MSLVGFDHVFVRALSFTFAEGIQYRVVPPPVIALLKIIAFMDDPHRRKKDLLDIGELFRHYEAASDRIFSDDVFAAGLDDIEYANAFLLGVDIGFIATDEEVEILSAFFGSNSELFGEAWSSAGPSKLAQLARHTSSCSDAKRGI